MPGPGIDQAAFRMIEGDVTVKIEAEVPDSIGPSELIIDEHSNPPMPIDTKNALVVQRNASTVDCCHDDKTILPIGQHQGKTYQYIRRHHRDFCEWAIMRLDPSLQLKVFVSYLMDKEDHWRSLYHYYRRSNEIVLFGQYKGHSYEDVAMMDKSYCDWCVQCQTPCQAMADFVNWLDSRP